MQNKVKYPTVEVVFPSSIKKYHYFCLLPVNKGDTVIVESYNGLGIAEVVNVHNENGRSLKAKAWVLDIVDAQKLRKKNTPT